MTGRRWKPYGLLAAACAGVLLASILSDQLLGHRVFESPELHAASLAVGALVAIIVALLLLGQDTAGARDDAPVAIGFLGMGILDGFHALATPGQAFVCLQSFAALAGALGFLLGWLPPAARRPAVFWTRWLPAAVAVGAVALGLLVALRPADFPSMIQGRTYTAAEILVQLTVGALFVLAALRFLIDYRRSDRIEVFLFGCMGMLFGAAALMVPFSAMWDGAWWTWHAVRFGAYLVALWLSHQRYVSVVASLRVAEALGENRSVISTERKRAEEATRFLSEASQVLASSIDFSTTLARVAELAVPQLADWCVILLAEEDGSLQPVKVACTDPGKVDIVRQLERRIPPPSTASSARAARSGQSELTRDITDEHMVASAIDPDQLAAMRRIGIRSRIAVPLRAEGRPLGAIVFLTAESQRRYDDQDLMLATEVGRRAAQAVANARLYQTAQRAIHTREEVLAVVSHDLRNPLGAISLSAKLIAQISPPGDGGDRVREKAQQIQQSVQRMDHLIRDLLDAAAIEAGRFPISRARCEAQSLVGDALELMRPMARERGLSLEWRAAGALPDLDCDRDRVLQVFSNLIGNAIKFTPEHGSITVSAEPGAREVRFAIADTGPGIPEDALPHLFDRYWQASHARSAGVGLGLYIVKGIVEAHGGKAWVESRPGGSTFFFTLPAGDA